MAKLHDADRSPCDKGQNPAVITREDRRDENHRDEAEQSRGTSWIVFQGFAPLHQPQREPDHLAEEKRFGHCRSLQIEQVWVEREKCERYDCRRGAQPMASESIYSCASGKIGQCRWDQSGDSIGPPCVNRNKGKHQQMRQRKPDRAKLRKSRAMRI